MIPVVGSLTNLGLVVLSFILGFFTRTVLPFEYKRYRRKAEQSSTEVDNWNKNTLKLLSEIQVLGDKLEYNRNPELKEKAENIENVRTQLEKHISGAPDGVSNDVVEKLREISVSMATIAAVYSDANNFPSVEVTEIPLESEYDSIKDGDGGVFIDRAVRDITNNTLDHKIYPIVDEIEDELDST